MFCLILFDVFVFHFYFYFASQSVSASNCFSPSILFAYSSLFYLNIHLVSGLLQLVILFIWFVTMLLLLILLATLANKKFYAKYTNVTKYPTANGILTVYSTISLEINTQKITPKNNEEKEKQNTRKNQKS